MGRTIGIDLGTTNTVVAGFPTGGQPKILEAKDTSKPFDAVRRGPEEAKGQEGRR